EGLCAIAVDSVARGAGPFVALPLFSIRLALVGLAFDRDADGCKARVVPAMHPVLEGRTAAAVDEDDAGKFSVAFFRQAVPGEDAGGFSLPWKCIVIQRADSAVGWHALGGMRGGRCGQLAEREHLLTQCGDVFSASGKSQEQRKQDDAAHHFPFFACTRSAHSSHIAAICFTRSGCCCAS